MILKDYCKRAALHTFMAEISADLASALDEHADAAHEALWNICSDRSVTLQIRVVLLLS